ncbi:MAG: fdhD [Phenylobacterium sp.]|jgi:FdhD protein|nr:fdhD [Phenylobacterium sp.]
MTLSAATTTSRLAVRGGVACAGERPIAEEVAVALVYGGSTHAVLMATPADLEDLAVGFSLTEGIVKHSEDIAELEVIDQADGVELRMWLAGPASDAFVRRRRAVVGPTGCGLCGVESLAEAVRPVAPVKGDLRLTPAELAHAVRLLDGQPLGAATRAVHAAGFWTPNAGMVAVREDVGRHNALDKLAGALARQLRSGQDGMVVLTSRVSVEMVQKAARLDVGVLAAISAPTALAIRTAQDAGVTLVAVARDDGFEVFSHPERLILSQ